MPPKDNSRKRSSIMFKATSFLLGAPGAEASPAPKTTPKTASKPERRKSIPLPPSGSTPTRTINLPTDDGPILTTPRKSSQTYGSSQRYSSLLSTPPSDRQQTTSQTPKIQSQPPSQPLHRPQSQMPSIPQHESMDPYIVDAGNTSVTRKRTRRPRQFVVIDSDVGASSNSLEAIPVQQREVSAGNPEFGDLMTSLDNEISLLRLKEANVSAAAFSNLTVSSSEYSPLKTSSQFPSSDAGQLRSPLDQVISPSGLGIHLDDAATESDATPVIAQITSVDIPMTDESVDLPRPAFAQTGQFSPATTASAEDEDVFYDVGEPVESSEELTSREDERGSYEPSFNSILPSPNGELGSSFGVDLQPKIKGLSIANADVVSSDEERYYGKSQVGDYEMGESEGSERDFDVPPYRPGEAEDALAPIPNTKQFNEGLHSLNNGSIDEPYGENLWQAADSVHTSPYSRRRLSLEMVDNRSLYRDDNSSVNVNIGRNDEDGFTRVSSGDSVLDRNNSMEKILGTGSPLEETVREPFPLPKLPSESSDIAGQILPATVESSDSNENEDYDLNFVARSPFYSPYEEEDLPKQMVVRNMTSSATTSEDASAHDRAIESEPAYSHGSDYAVSRDQSPSQESFYPTYASTDALADVSGSNRLVDVNGAPRTRRQQIPITATELTRDSQQSTLVANSTGHVPDGLGIRSAYVAALRKKAGTAYSEKSKQSASLPIAIRPHSSATKTHTKTLSKSSSDSWRKSILSSADIKHGTLKPRLLASEVDDDDDVSSGIVTPLTPPTVETPGEQLRKLQTGRSILETAQPANSTNGLNRQSSIRSTFTYRPSEPGLKLFIANPDTSDEEEEGQRYPEAINESDE
ncbi:unnamed protein product [Kuraishia capsulata CBS 1993]|uniref:Altered inheritance of mitochondria protein 21 n=1 Tax=Kuraishia capsulata CBS 1993 TaxID=1382522 RepID=W6MHX8_9ASCO|nr:uncharacterized protein KUCA_T00001626001 [Kuraishia capsulata CBS 1993]CDK25656.1 unnamed protein product [Kuraishia capsulata CBS 1993]